MDVADVHELVDRIAADAGAVGVARLSRLLADVSRLRRWCDGRAARFTETMRSVSATPEMVVGDALGVSRRDGARLVERSDVLAQLPRMAEALDGAVVSGEHVDVAAAALRAIEPDLRDQLAAVAEDLAPTVGARCPDEFARRLRAEARRLRTDGGVGRLEQQRRNARLRHWVDTDGMWCLSGRFDPVTGLALDAALRRAVDVVRAEGIPDGAPDDPLIRHQWLAAHACARLLTQTPLTSSDANAGRRSGGRSSRGVGGGGGVTVVVDTTQIDADGRPRIDWGLPDVEIPDVVIADLLRAGARVRPVVLHDGAVMSAPGQMNLGRTRALASADQRAVLRAVYPQCVVGDCTVPFEHCDVHHVHWRRHGGTTDLDNLRPVCIKHHHAIHDAGWHLEARADGTNIIRLPDDNHLVSHPATRQPTPQTRGVDAAGSSPAAEPNGSGPGPPITA